MRELDARYEAKRVEIPLPALFIGVHQLMLNHRVKDIILSFKAFWN
jgi:hypothetical protein